MIKIKSSQSGWLTAAAAAAAGENIRLDGLCYGKRLLDVEGGILTRQVTSSPRKRTFDVSGRR